MGDLGLPALYNAVTARFVQDAADANAASPPPNPLVVAVPNEFGWRRPTNQVNTPSATFQRVMWVPGDPDNGELGELMPPVRPGRTPERPLATLGEIFTVYIYGADIVKGNETNELLQYQSARKLFDYFYKTLYHAAYDIGSGARVLLTKAQWLIDKKERPHGAVIRAAFTIEAAITDDAMVFVDATPPFVGEFATALEQPQGGNNPPIVTDDGTVTVTPDPNIP